MIHSRPTGTEARNGQRVSNRNEYKRRFHARARCRYTEVLNGVALTKMAPARCFATRYTDDPPRLFSRKRLRSPRRAEGSHHPFVPVVVEWHHLKRTHRRTASRGVCVCACQRGVGEALSGNEAARIENKSRRRRCTRLCGTQAMVWFRIQVVKARKYRRKQSLQRDPGDV